MASLCATTALATGLRVDGERPLNACDSCNSSMQRAAGVPAATLRPGCRAATVGGCWLLQVSSGVHTRRKMFALALLIAGKSCHRRCCCPRCCRRSSGIQATRQAPRNVGNVLQVSQTQQNRRCSRSRVLLPHCRLLEWRTTPLPTALEPAQEVPGVIYRASEATGDRSWR